MKQILRVLPLFFCFSASKLAAKNIDITQKGKAFKPKEVTLQVGDQLTFVNDDGTMVHNVYSSSKDVKPFDLGQQQPGQKDSVVFDKPGELLVRCAIHPTMKLKVKITEPKKAD